MLRRLLVLAFGLLYNELAWTYDLVSWGVSIGQWRSWQRAALPYLRGKRILEIAHGTGNMLLDLAALGFQPVGLDASPAMGHIARRKIRSKGLDLPLLRGRVQALPFEDNSFPSILSTFPAEFIASPSALAEFYRVLQPGGVMVIVPLALITGPTPPDRFADWLFRVTGQTGDWHTQLSAIYTAAGFSARAERLRLPRSLVIVIIAEKTV